MSEATTPAASTALVDPVALLEHLPMNAYVLRAQDGDFVLEGVNAAARTTTPGLATMLGRPISLLYADQPDIIADARRCHAERTRIERELLVRRHERVEGIRQALVFVSLDAARIAIFARDVPNDGGESAELYEVRERYRSLLASLPDAMLLRGSDGRIVAANDTAAQLLGYEKASDLWGLNFALADGYRMEKDGQTVDPSRSASQRSAREGEVIRGELYRRIGPGGETKWILVSAQPVRKSDGSLGGSVTVYSDATAQVEARLAEQRAAKQLQMALDAGRMGIWEYDPVADVGDWSPTLTETFRLGKDGPPGLRGYLAHIHVEDRDGAQRFLQDMLTRRDEKPFEHEHRLVGSDGVTRWARISGRLETRDGHPRLLGTAMDVTERRRMQDELLHAGRLESLGRLAGGLAHDFNNLLSAMLGSIELLGDVCPEAGQEDLTTLRHVTLRARDLTAQLLAFARQQRTELESLELAALVGQVERLLKRLVGPTIHLVFDTSSVGEGLHVRADAAQLEQVLVNLVVNARDAMPEGGRVTIKLGAEAEPGPAHGWAVLEVRDEGRGIQKDDLARVFDPFFTTKATGTGLGLASSYGVVRSHGGSIRVHSEPGHGACFQVRLPRVPPPPPRPASSRAPTLGGGLVLLVDDDDAVRVTTARILKTLGYEVLSAADGAAAEALAREHRAALDLLVCDLAMPHKNGREVARDILLLRPDLKVLFVSGYPREDERELPAESFLQKPFDRDALARKLSALGAGKRGAPPSE